MYTCIRVYVYIRTLLNFFENLRRYSQFSVHHRCRWHRWQMKKSSIRKILIILFRQLWVVELTSIYSSCLQVHPKVSAAWYCSLYLPPVSMTPVTNLPLVWLITDVNNTSGTGGKICRMCCWYRWIFAACVVDTGGNFDTGVIDASGKFANGVVDTSGAPCTCEYLRKFLKKFEMTLMLFSGAWGKVIHEKNLKQKILWHCPFKPLKIARSFSSLVILRNGGCPSMRYSWTVICTEQTIH